MGFVPLANPPYTRYGGPAHIQPRDYSNNVRILGELRRRAEALASSPPAPAAAPASA